MESAVQPSDLATPLPPGSVAVRPDQFDIQTPAHKTCEMATCTSCHQQFAVGYDPIFPSRANTKQQFQIGNRLHFLAAKSFFLP